MQTMTVDTGLCLDNILLATALSPASRLVLRYGVSLARHFGSKLHIVHVITPQDTAMPIYPVLVPYDSEVRMVKQGMSNLLASTAVDDVAYEVSVAQGQLWPTLAGLCDSRGIGMILLGTEGHSGFTKLLFGSAAEEIIRSAPCPVMTIGPHCRTRDAPEFEMRQIVCATDLLPGSHAVSEFALNLAEANGARLTLLHAEGSMERERVEQAKADLRKQLSNMPRYPEQSRVVEYLVEQGPTPEAILNAAGPRGADVIVLGARHTDHPVLTAHSNSNTIHHVLSHASCPVLTLQADVY